MKATIERATLLRCLSHVQSVVERRNTIPILANVLLRARDGGLELTATDMEIAVVERFPATVARSGAATVPAATLYEIVRKLPEGAQIELDHPGGDAPLSLRAGRFATSMNCLPTEDFPVMAEGQLPHRFTVPAAAVRALIDRTRFAISTEETRYYLNGIYLHEASSEGTQVLRAVATDGHRLARVDEPLPEGAEKIPGVIIPRKTVLEVRKLADETTEPVTIALSDTKIAFELDAGRIKLVSKLIDGTFPDYGRVIPLHNDKQLDVECKPFAAAVDRVSAISSDRTRAVKLKVADGVLVLAATSHDHGSATEEIEVQYAGEGMEIGFNSRYLLDIAQQIRGESVRLLMADSGAPTIIQELGDASALYVLMPMRV